jgi:hypothetical protein
VGKSHWKTRRRARSDGNQGEVVAAIREGGYAVEVVSDIGRGIPDLLVSRRGCERTRLVEVKRPGESLTVIQEAFHATWPDPIPVVDGPEDALAKLNALTW